jgi:hypothetical protein
MIANGGKTIGSQYKGRNNANVYDKGQNIDKTVIQTKWRVNIDISSKRRKI